MGLVTRRSDQLDKLFENFAVDPKKPKKKSKKKDEDQNKNKKPADKQSSVKPIIKSLKFQYLEFQALFQRHQFSVVNPCG